MTNTLAAKYQLSDATAPSGEEYWGHRGAGVILFSEKTQRFLFLLRSEDVTEPGTWSGAGGKVEKGEDPKKAARREAAEELGFKGAMALLTLHVYKDTGFRYTNYLGVVADEFHPKLNWENDDWVWVEYGDWPTPLHFGVAEALKQADGIIKYTVKVTKQDQEKKLREMDAPPPAIVQQEPAKPSNVLSKQQIMDAYIVAATLWLEARGEGEQGMQAVMNVIMNRAGGDFSKTRSVVLKPKQFSCWNGVSNPAKETVELSKSHGKEAPFKTAVKLVDQAMKGRLEDITNGATHYFNPKQVKPSWAKTMKFKARIGNHDFYEGK